MGTYIVHLLLDRGYAVRAMKRPGSDIRIIDAFSRQPDWFEAEIPDIAALETAVEGMDYVVHAAAMVSFLRRDHKRMMAVNVEGTRQVVDTCLARGIRKLVYISSVSALGRHSDLEVINEEVFGGEGSFESAYSLSKFLAEMEVWRGIGEGLDAAMVNPSIILGAGHWHRSSLMLFKTVAQGFRFYPDGITGFVDVRDVARAAVMLLESDISAERFIVSSENLYYRDLFRMMAEALGVRPPNVHAGKALAVLAMVGDQIASFFSGRTPRLTRETVCSSYQSVRYDAGKIQKVLDFEFIPVEQTIRESAALYKEHPEFAMLSFTDH